MHKLAVIIFFSVASTSAHAAWFSESRDIMGTAIHTEVWSDSPAVARDAIGAVMTAMHAVDDQMSVYKASSELSKVNRDAGKNPVQISKNLFDLIKFSIHISELTDGAFDITYASIGRYYDYRKKQRPDAAKINSLLPAISYKHIVLDDAKQTIAFTDPRVYIDLGGIAKGYVVDQCIDLLKARHVEHAIVTAGGDSRIIGDKDGHPWMVGIKSPRAPDAVSTVVPIEDAAISTSGDYERYFESNGKRYHHIINPWTGDSAREVQSVSIIAPYATLTDGLTKGVFIKGVEKGLAMINKMDGVDVIIIDRNGKLHFSNGLAQIKK